MVGHLIKTTNPAKNHGSTFDKTMVGYLLKFETTKPEKNHGIIFDKITGTHSTETTVYFYSIN